MKDISKISSVYFIGIGGIGMSALARYFNGKGVQVGGYDKTETILTRQLQAEGIEIHFEDDVSLIDKSAELVIYTPAIPREHKEYNYFLDHDYPVFKRSDVLGMITANSYSVCVAGTHGKTTTSAMIAHILRHSGYGCNAFLGGIASNYDTNFWSDEKNVSVAEADEYDRSFLKLNPDIAVITSIDADHLDIYGTEKALQDAFIGFSSKIKRDGLLISKYGLPRSNEFAAHDIIRYSLESPEADVCAANIEITNGNYRFNVLLPEDEIKGVELNMGGMHNIENTVAAIAVAKHIGISDREIKAAVAAFKGVKRRFEYIIKEDDLVMIDDYAHHPEELRALISAAKELFPEKKCSIVFQPHLFSRTRDHASSFSEVLGIADEIFLLPVYPARELAIPGVNSELISEKMKMKQVRVMSKEELLNEFRQNVPELLIIAGAGDIDAMTEPVKDILLKQRNN